jgi:hypothetical protein
MHLKRSMSEAGSQRAGSSLPAGRKENDACVARERWIAAFAWRTCSLRPEINWSDARAWAEALWCDLSHFDPSIAAEIEYESRSSD